MRSWQHCQASRGRPARRGFSLIEVIMATAILLGSAVVLSRLAGMGRTYAQNTTQLAQAQRVCENTLNEIMMGLRPLATVESAPLMPVAPGEFRDEERGEDRREVLRPGRPQDRLVSASNRPRWLHSVRLRREDEAPGLMSLTVEVVQSRRSDGRRMRCSLTRWIREAPERNPFDGFGDGDQQLSGGIN
jgi:prepilin-type N-terminal cleavage/methylation domain-containing protein